MGMDGFIFTSLLEGNALDKCQNTCIFVYEYYKNVLCPAFILKCYLQWDIFSCIQLVVKCFNKTTIYILNYIKQLLNTNIKVNSAFKAKRFHLTVHICWYMCIYGLRSNKSTYALHLCLAYIFLHIPDISSLFWSQTLRVFSKRI